MTPEHAETVALWRFSIISEAISPRLSPGERGQLVRSIATRPHEDAQGRPCTISRNTLDRWVAAYRAHGLDGLRPVPRSDNGSVRKHEALYELAAHLRQEHPARSAAAIADIIALQHGVKLPARTVREFLQRRGLQRASLENEPRVFGRYEAARPNERWIGDVLKGPWVPYPRVATSRKVNLFLLVDDHSRLLVRGEWTTHENTRAGQDVLRHAITRRGKPEQLYVDHGSPYVTAHLRRTCAVLGIRLIHSRAYYPQGRGKQERLNRPIKERFILEATAAGITDLAQFNDRFEAWAEDFLNSRVHSETLDIPLQRFMAHGEPPAVDQNLLAEAFRWSAFRVVTTTAHVALLGNRYQVDASLVGHRVELRFDPEDMATIAVYDNGIPAGVATPFVLRHHSHPQVPQAKREPVPPTGVDYLGLMHARHQEAEAPRISYQQLPLRLEDTQPDDTEEIPS